MSIREELKRRALRAMAGFVCGMVVGISLVVGPLVLFARLHRWQDPRAESIGFHLALMASFTAGAASILAGPLHAHLLGRGLCCEATWPLLNLGRDLDRMKCCPYCGRSLDEELPAKGRQKKSTTKGDMWEDEFA
jgi:hypothetical protein